MVIGAVAEASEVFPLCRLFHSVEVSSGVFLLRMFSCFRCAVEK